jgi:hypothetical protein
MILKSNNVFTNVGASDEINRLIKSYVTDINSNVTHIGIAAPGSSKADAVWSIFSISYPAPGPEGVTDIRLCEGTWEAKFIFNDYASYEYK